MKSSNTDWIFGRSKKKSIDLLRGAIDIHVLCVVK